MVTEMNSVFVPTNATKATTTTSAPPITATTGAPPITGTATTSPRSKSPPDPAPVGAIAGGVVGGIIAFGLIIRLFLLFKNKNQQSPNGIEDPKGSNVVGNENSMVERRIGAH